MSPALRTMRRRALLDGRRCTERVLATLMSLKAGNASFKTTSSTTSVKPKEIIVDTHVSPNRRACAAPWAIIVSILVGLIAAGAAFALGFSVGREGVAGDASLLSSPSFGAQPVSWSDELSCSGSHLRRHFTSYKGTPHAAYMQASAATLVLDNTSRTAYEVHTELSLIHI